MGIRSLFLKAPPFLCFPLLRRQQPQPRSSQPPHRLSGLKRWHGCWVGGTPTPPSNPSSPTGPRGCGAPSLAASGGHVTAKPAEGASGKLPTGTGSVCAFTFPTRAACKAGRNPAGHLASTWVRVTAQRCGRGREEPGAPAHRGAAIPAPTACLWAALT